MPQAIARHLEKACGSGLVALLHFGSTLTRAAPGPASAHDLFVVVASYAGFYRCARSAIPLPRSPRLLSVLNRFLPPNVLFCAGSQGRGPGAKLFVISERDLARALSPGARDHFCRARLMQRVAIVYARDEATRARMERLLRQARREALVWMRPYAGARFTTEEFSRRMIEFSYGREIRPERGDRSREIFEAQRTFLLREFGRLLQEAAGEGRLVREGEYFRYACPAGPAERWRQQMWFARSKLRATARWVKHALTFEGWLEYLVAKVERRTGVEIKLTPRRRRYPWITLWPEFFRVMRSRGRRPGGKPYRGASP